MCGALPQGVAEQLCPTGVGDTDRACKSEGRPRQRTGLLSSPRKTAITCKLVHVAMIIVRASIVLDGAYVQCLHIKYTMTVTTRVHTL